MTRYQVVIIYQDPRGGIWRGPLESKEQAEKRYARELTRKGAATVWLHEREVTP